MIVDNELQANISGYGLDEDIIMIDIDYDQKTVMHELQDKIDDYYDDEDED